MKPENGTNSRMLPSMYAVSWHGITRPRLAAGYQEYILYYVGYNMCLL